MSSGLASCAASRIAPRTRPSRASIAPQAAVIEGAVLVSRLHLLARAEVEAELARLDIIVGKTAGPAEAEAWGWLKDKAAQVFAAGARGGQSLQAIPVIDLMRRPGRPRANRAIGRPTGRSNPRSRRPATRWMSCGGLLAVYPFPTLYVADLDAIQRDGDNFAALRRIREAFPALQMWIDNGAADCCRNRGAHRCGPGRAGHRQRIAARQRPHRAAQRLEAGRALARFSRRRLSGP